MLVVSVQEVRQRLCNKHYFLHFGRDLSDQLLAGEILVKAVVSPQVFDIGIVSVTPEEVEVLAVRLLLDNKVIFEYSVDLHLLFLNVWLSSIAFSDLFNYSNKEASSVLVVRHQS